MKNHYFLILLALFGFTTIATFTMYEKRHDPNWAKHAFAGGGAGGQPQAEQRARGEPLLNSDGGGFVPSSADRPLNGRGAESHRIVSLDLVKGKDYFADYDTSMVRGPPKIPPLAPGQRPAFQYVDVTSPHSMWVGKWLSHSPNVVAIPEFLTDWECDEMIRQAEPQMFRSQVAPYQNSNTNPVNEVRTSSQAWLNPRNGVAKQVVDRIMSLLRDFDPSSHEELQVLRYTKGQYYRAHEDSFDPQFYGKQPTNRAVTAYLYLSDVAKGGETNFPRATGRQDQPRPPPTEFASCDKGLAVRPKKRMLAVFYDANPVGPTLDHTSLHGACPVQEGVKYGGTLWIRVPMP